MHRTAYLLLLFAALFWAGNAVAAKFAAGHISPMLLTAGRWFVAIAILVAIGHRNLARDWPVIRRNLPYLMAMGTVGFTFFNACLYTAVNYTTAINASILQAAVPMVIFIANFALFRIRVSAGQIGGFLLTVAGVAVVASQGNLAQLAAFRINFGDALMLIAIVAYASYTVALRGMPKLHWQSMMIALSVGALLSAMVFAGIEIAAGKAQLPDASGWIALIYASIFPAILSQTFYIRGNALIGGNRAGLFVNLVPVFGTLLSVVVLSERLHAYHVFALALVFAGIWLAERKR